MSDLFSNQTNQNDGKSFSFFSNALLMSSGQDNQENSIDSKFQLRQAKFLDEENFDELKRNTMVQDLNEGQAIRNRMIQERRLKKKINCEETESLKNKLTISQALYDECEKSDIKVSDYNEIIKSFRTEEINQKYKGLVGIRKLLSFNMEATIQQLIDIGIVTDLLNLLGNSPAEFQFESLWCLTNISTGTSDQANTIILKGGIPKIIPLMDSKIEELKNQALWLIGNLASDSQKIRDLLLKEKTIEKILTILNTTQNNGIIKNCCWAISNFCRVKPEPPFEFMLKCLKGLVHALYCVPQEKEFLTDVCYVLSFMTETYKEAGQEIIKIGVVPKLLTLLDLDITYVQLSCLRVFGNIASGNANDTQYLIDQGILSKLKKTIFHIKSTVRKESAWILSNIAAGTPLQVETLIRENFLEILKTVVKNDDPEIQKEVIWAICNLTSTDKPELLQVLFNQGILNVICEFLKLEDPRHLAVSIEAFTNLLKFGEERKQNGINPVVQEVEKLGMYEYLEKLEYHPVELVYEKILKVLETYFDVENQD